jgi:ATP-dependent RNA helicase DDX35
MINYGISFNTSYIQVGITEPRRVAATTLAARVAEEKNCNLGDLVGYSIRFDECFDRDRTKIKFMTEGILVREMLGDPLLKAYSVLILDEVHERTAQIDIIMGLLKKVMRKRRDLKVIISSATVDAEYIRDFFNYGSDKGGKKEAKDRAAILSVEGTNYSVDVHYLKDPCPDYVKCCFETVMKLHEIEPPGDILVFLTGMDEVDHCVSLLRENARGEQKSRHGLKLWPLPMYGSLPAHDQLKVFRPAMRGSRKIIVATNIAETSITIEGIVYVIDSCFVKLKWYNSDTNVDALLVTELSQASAEQRAGRAGRTRPGQCYRLCTEEGFKKLSLNTPPEMQRTDLASAVLQLKALGIDNVVKFEFPSAPPSKNLISCLELLYALGAIDDAGNLTSPLGENMCELPVHPTVAKMLLGSGDFGCSQEIAVIVAMLQVENVYLEPPNQRGKARIAKRNFEVAEGDLLTLLNVFNAFKKQEANSLRHWCSSHFLNYKALKRANQLYEQGWD